MTISFFDSEEISGSDGEFIIDLINRTNFIADAKRFPEDSNVPKIEIVHPDGIEKKEQTSIDDDKKKRKYKC